MGLEILRPWRSVEKISICPVHTGMNLEQYLCFSLGIGLPRMHGDNPKKVWIFAVDIIFATYARGYTRFDRR